MTHCLYFVINHTSDECVIENVKLSPVYIS